MFRPQRIIEVRAGGCTRDVLSIDMHRSRSMQRRLTEEIQLPTKTERQEIGDCAVSALEGVKSIHLPQTIQYTLGHTTSAPY